MKKLLVGIALVIIACVAWYLLSPLFVDSVVDEEFPENVSQQAPNTNLEGEVAPDQVSESTSEPLLIARGEFTGTDDFHEGSGVASIYTLTTGENVLRFENFNVTNGPDLRVLLVSNPNGDIDSGYTEIAKLKGNIGDQNYTLDASINPDEYGSVVIYCEPFNVNFSVAPLN